MLRQLSPGLAGLFLLIRKITTDKVLADLQGVGGVVMKTSFDHTREEELSPLRRRPSPTDANKSDSLASCRREA
jgi:uncharacterized membrane protein